MNTPQTLIRKRIASHHDCSGTIIAIDDETFTVDWDNGTSVTYPINLLEVDNCGGNLRVNAVVLP